jgi:hypothetical protein
MVTALSGANAQPIFPITSEYKITSNLNLSVTNSTDSFGIGGYVLFSNTSNTQEIFTFNTHGDELYHFASIVPRPILRYPVTINDAWINNGNSNGYPVVSHTNVESTFETITVPAGTFTGVVKTRTYLEFPSGYDQQIYDDSVEVWYAPDIGFIKIKAHQNGTGDFFIGELKNFSVTHAGSSFSPDYFPMDIGNTWSIEWNRQSSNGSTASLTYSATVTSNQNTVLQASNSFFGQISRGTSKTINDSVILNNIGVASAKVEARFIDNIGGVFGLINGASVLNATNFALGPTDILEPLSNDGINVQIATIPPGTTSLNARLSVPSDQLLGDYIGTVILTFSDV